MDTTLQAREDEPAPRAEASSPPGPMSAALPPRPARHLFDADTPAQPDLLSRGARAAFLADVVLHPQTETPLCLGLFGRPGSGKSTFLNLLLQRIEGMHPQDAARRTVVARLDAESGVELAEQLTRALLGALSAIDPKRAAHVGQAGADPHAAVRQAGDRLSEIRGRLDSERQALDDLTGRRTRLADTVLFETAGSRIDAYARANRARIDRSLQRFGISGEPVATFKQLVRDASEPGGALGSASGGTRAFFSYRGQARSIVIAVILFVLAWGLGFALDNQATLTDTVRGFGDKMGPVADWLAGHAAWLSPLRTLLVSAGFLAVALNIWRGLRFLQPITRGVTLLKSDIDTRARELDTRLSQQTQRVDTLARDAERASHHLAEAEARLSSIEAGVEANEQVDRSASTPLDAILAAVQRWLTRPASATGADRRIVVAIDGLERLSGPAAADLVRLISHVLTRPGFVTLIAIDRDQLAAGLSETDPAGARAMIDRIVQVPISLDAMVQQDDTTLVRRMLGIAALAASEGNAEGLQDRQWQDYETVLMETLVPIAGGTPRAMRRFINLYRLARLDPALSRATHADFGALALVLAGRISGAIGAYKITSPAELIEAGDEGFAAARRSVATILDLAPDFRGCTLGLRTAEIYEAR